MGASFLHKLGQKIVILRGFQQEFFRTAGFLLKFSILQYNETCDENVVVAI